MGNVQVAPKPRAIAWIVVTGFTFFLGYAFGALKREGIPEMPGGYQLTHDPIGYALGALKRGGIPELPGGYQLTRDPETDAYMIDGRALIVPIVERVASNGRVIAGYQLLRATGERSGPGWFVLDTQMDDLRTGLSWVEFNDALDKAEARFSDFQFKQLPFFAGALADLSHCDDEEIEFSN